MNIEGTKILVLGGFGLVGRAVCQQLLPKNPKEILIHSLRPEEAEEARKELAPEAGETELTTCSGDIFSLAETADRLERIRAQIARLKDDDLDRYSLYRLLMGHRPDIVIDCVNTATGIAYRDIFTSAEETWSRLVDDTLDAETAQDLMESLYVPRLIRHIQLLYRGMQDAETGCYMKVGTTGTGGMGLNIPYTHSEERPSRVLLAKSALGGAHSMLLFLMARTPGAPITKEIKPAAAIAWKKIAYGPIYRGREPIYLVDAEPRHLGPVFSTVDPEAAHTRDEILQTVYIDTGENGIFSLEEFAMLTTSEQMEFVTPEEIAQYLIFEIEGGSTGYDVVNALDNAVMGPTYRAGLMRHWALERMCELQEEHDCHSVGFEMLGPPRNTKLLYEAHLLRLAFGTMTAVRQASPEAISESLDALVRDQPEVANEVVAVGFPILLPSGEVIRGPKVIVPGNAHEEQITPELLEAWIYDGWVDLRKDNCARWIERFRQIHEEMESIPPGDTSSRYLRNRSFWHDENVILPGKILGWVLSVEEEGARIKG